jgi:group I intron endonuclease
MLPKGPGIYKITNIENGHFYIGSSVNIYNRIKNHFSYLKRGKHANTHLQRSFDIYGLDSFNVEVLEECPQTEQKILLEIEQKYIDMFWDGGNTCYNMSKSSQAPNGFIHTETWKKLMSEKFSGSNNPMYGKTTSKEVRKKQSEARKRFYEKNGTMNKKPVISIELNNNNFERTFCSVREAAQFYNVFEGNIAHILAGKRNTCNKKTVTFKWATNT